MDHTNVSKCASRKIELADPVTLQPSGHNACGATAGRGTKMCDQALTKGHVIVDLLAADCRIVANSVGEVHTARFCNTCAASYEARVEELGCQAPGCSEFRSSNPVDTAELNLEVESLCDRCALSAVVERARTAQIAAGVAAALVVPEPAPRIGPPGRDGRIPGFDRTGAAVGDHARTYVATDEKGGQDRMPVPLEVALLYTGKLTVLVEAPRADGDARRSGLDGYFYFGADVRGVTHDMGAVELYIPALGLRFELPFGDLRGFVTITERFRPSVTRQAMSPDSQRTLDVADGESALDENLKLSPEEINDMALAIMEARNTAKPPPPPASLRATPTPRKPYAAPAVPGASSPAVKAFLRRPELMGDRDNHGNLVNVGGPEEAKREEENPEPDALSAPFASICSPDKLPADRPSSRASDASGFSFMAEPWDGGDGDSTKPGASGGSGATLTPGHQPDSHPPWLNPQAIDAGSHVGNLMNSASPGFSPLAPTLVPPTASAAKHAVVREVLTPIKGIRDEQFILVEGTASRGPVLGWIRRGALSGSTCELYGHDATALILRHGATRPGFYSVANGHQARFQIITSYALAMAAMAKPCTTGALRQHRSYDDAFNYLRSLAAAEIASNAGKPADFPHAGMTRSDEERDPTVADLSEQLAGATEIAEESKESTEKLAKVMAAQSDSLNRLVTAITTGKPIAATAGINQAPDTALLEQKSRAQVRQSIAMELRADKDTTGISFDYARCQLLAVLRLSEPERPTIGDNLYGAELYCHLLSLTQKAPIFVPELVALKVTLHVTHNIAADLSELRITSKKDCDGLGVVETPSDNPLINERINLAEQKNIRDRRSASKRQKTVPKEMTADAWGNNRKQYAHLVHGIVGPCAGEALAESTEDLITRFNNNRTSMDVPSIDDLYVDLHNAWLQAGRDVLSHLAISQWEHLDSVITKVTAEFAANPMMKVKAPTFANFPELLLEHDKTLAARNAETLGALRLGAFGTIGSGTRADVKPSADGADAGTSELSRDERRKERAKTEREKKKKKAAEKKETEKKAAEAKKTPHASGAGAPAPAPADNSEPPYHAGALSGNPGGQPAPHGPPNFDGKKPEDARFWTPKETMVEATDKDPRGPTGKCICRKCNSNEYSGKPWRGVIKKCPESTLNHDHVRYPDGAELPKAVAASLCSWGGRVGGKVVESHNEAKAEHDRIMSGPGLVKAGESSVAPAVAAPKRTVDAADVSPPAEEEIPRGRNMSERAEANGTVVISAAESKDALSLIKPELDVSTGLDELIQANGGHANFANFRPDEAALAQSLSTKKDAEWLKPAWHIVGKPTPGVARALANSESDDRDRRASVMSSIARSRLLTDLPFVLEGAVPGDTAIKLEQLDGSRSHFTDKEVRDAAVTVLLNLSQSADPKIKKAAGKFVDNLVGDAARTESSDVPHVGAARAANAYSRTPPDADGNFTAYLPDGRGGTYEFSVHELGDKVAVRGRMRNRACVVVAGAGAARKDGHDVRPGEILADMTAQALASELHVVPEEATPTHCHLMEAGHDLTRSGPGDVPHDLTTLTYEAFPPKSLAKYAMRTIDADADRVLNLHHTRGRLYAGQPVTSAILLERGPSKYRQTSHALRADLPPELWDPVEFDAWGARLRESAGVTLNTGVARGWRRMIADAATREAPVPTSTMKKCPWCEHGEHGARAGADGDGVDGAADDVGAVPASSSDVAGGGALASSLAATINEAILNKTQTQYPHSGECALQSPCDSSSLVWFDDEGEMLGSMDASGDGASLKRVQLENEAEDVSEAHTKWLETLNQDVEPPQDAPIDTQTVSDGEHAGSEPAKGCAIKEKVKASTARAQNVAMALVTAMVAAPKKMIFAWVPVFAVLAATLVYATGSPSAAVIAFRTAWRPLNGATHSVQRFAEMRPFIGERGYEHLMYTARDGIKSHYEGPTERRMQLPLASARGHLNKFWEKTWELQTSGRVLVMPEEVASDFDVISSPIGGVPKNDNSGADTGMIRFFHHLSKESGGIQVNLMSDKYAQGPIFYPRLIVVIRRCLALARKYPGSRIVIKLFDVDGAFTRCDVAADCVHQFATDIPGAVDLDSEGTCAAADIVSDATSPEVCAVISEACATAEEWMTSGSVRRRGRGGSHQNYTVMYLTGTFGHIALPPQYGMAAMKPISDYHVAATAAAPYWHGNEPFTSWTYVDDTADVTPDWGLRRWASEQRVKEGFFLALGPEAYNQSKEGAYGTQNTIWGRGLDTESEAVYYSPPRVMRLARKAWNPEFNRGNRRVLLQSVQSLHGSIRNMAEVTRAFRAHHRAISRFLATCDPERRYVMLKQQGKVAELRWNQFWDAIDQYRLLVADEEFWRTGYLSSFSGVLTPRERLAIPGEASRRVYFGSDATPWALCVIDYAAGLVGVVIWTEELDAMFREALSNAGVPAEEIPEAIISIKELFAPVLGVAAWGHKYTNKLIICPVDNQTAGAWVAKHEADNFMAEAILHILSRLEMRQHTELVAPYIWTHRNKLPDIGSGRFAPSATTADEMTANLHLLDEYLADQHPGFKRVDLTETAEFYLKRCTLRLPPLLHDEPLDSPVAQGMLTRERSSLPLPSVERLGLIECCAGSGQVTGACVDRKVKIIAGFEWAGPARAVYKIRFGDGHELFFDVTNPAEWAQLTPEQKRAVTTIFGGFPCPAYSEANLDRKGDTDPRSFLMYETMVIVFEDPHFNYNKGGNLLSLGGENVVGKERFSLMSREQELAGSYGYLRSSVKVLATELNDEEARLRLIEEYVPWQMILALGPLQLLLPEFEPRKMRDCITPPSERLPCCYVDTWAGEWVFVEDLGPVTNGLRPRRSGYVYGGGRKHHCWTDDTAWTVKASGEPPKRSGGAFYRCSKTGRVFVLDEEDCWKLQGLPMSALEEWRRSDAMVSSTQVRRVAGNAITAGTAAFVAEQIVVKRPLTFLAMLDRGLCRTERTCHVPEDAVAEIKAMMADDARNKDAMDAERHLQVATTPAHAGDNSSTGSAGWAKQMLCMLVWFSGLTGGVARAASSTSELSGSRRGSLREFVHYESLELLREAYPRAGMTTNPEDVLDYDALRRSAAGIAYPDGIPAPAASASRKQIWTPSMAKLLPKIGDHLVLGGLAKSTSNKYQSAFNQYALFTDRMCRDSGEHWDLWLTGDNPAREEQHLLNFVAYEGWLMGNKHSTVKGKLLGVRWHHLYAGLPNPIEGKFRLTAALRALKKLRGDSSGKLPVTPQMLRSVRRGLNMRRSRDVVTWAALMFGFFFMMRCSEYLATGGVFDPTRALTVDKVLPHIDENPVDDAYRKADSVTALFEISKTDQNRVGCTRTCYRSGTDL